jgi:hypothetical protein
MVGKMNERIYNFCSDGRQYLLCREVNGGVDDNCSRRGSRVGMDYTASMVEGRDWTMEGTVRSGGARCFTPQYGRVSNSIVRLAVVGRIRSRMG